MKLVKNVFPTGVIYLNLSKNDIIDHLRSSNITNYDNQQVAIRSWMQVHEDLIQIKREPSVYESFRGAGEVSFKLFSTERGTKIVYGVQLCSKPTIIKGIISLTLFLLVLAFYIFYLFGIQVISIVGVLFAWLLIFLVLYNGLNHHILQLKTYSQLILDQIRNCSSGK